MEFVGTGRAAARPVASLSLSGSGAVDTLADLPNVEPMKRNIQINAWWDEEANVWLATSEDVTGLCVEAETWGRMIEEVRLVLPDLMPLNKQSAEGLSLTFRAEAHLDLARAS